MFNDLVAGAELTVRATAPGYRAIEKGFLASAASGFSPVIIELSADR
jgi:hypothetical protein